jgi:Xaa-Pro aminopeptidase
MENVYAQRVASLRDVMARNGWDAVVIGGSDPHSSEYPAPRWRQVEWLIGFTAEAGDVVVTEDHVGLWTDSRYFIQAELQLKATGGELHKTRVPGAVSIPQWLSDKAKVVAVDGICQSVDAVSDLKAAIGDGGVIVDVPDLLEELWSDRPACPVTPITTLDVECFGGIPRNEKLQWLREWMLQGGYDKMLLSSLDEIAWLLNVRASDIDYNPLVISYLVVTQDYARWFVRKPGLDESDFPDTWDSFEELRHDGVEIWAYDEIFGGLSDEGDGEADGTIFVDPSTLNSNIYNYICNSFREGGVVCGTSPVVLAKAVKTSSEIEHLRQTFVDDGVAMERFLHWLEMEVQSGKRVTEWEASEKLTSFRAEIPGYRGNSFENISAYGPSAALPHYVISAENPVYIQPRGLYLVDSGGQYLTGTTDITRTVPMGECSFLEKEDYTLVLKGMVDLSMAVFPRGTAGCQIDALARMPLWKARRNFGHGTGHGVGYYLCVHEGPQSIRYQYNPQPLLPGMLTSNEPALYREGMHGVRHENLILCREAGSSEFGDWLDFETMTLCHIDTSAILVDLLDDQEKAWLNAYNERVFRELSPFLSDEVAQWLREKTKALI